VILNNSTKRIILLQSIVRIWNGNIRAPFKMINLLEKEPYQGQIQGRARVGSIPSLPPKQLLMYIFEYFELFYFNFFCFLSSFFHRRKLTLNMTISFCQNLKNFDSSCCRSRTFVQFWSFTFQTLKHFCSFQSIFLACLPLTPNI